MAAAARALKAENSRSSARRQTRHEGRQFWRRRRSQPTRALKAADGRRIAAIKNVFSSPFESAQSNHPHFVARGRIVAAKSSSSSSDHLRSPTQSASRLQPAKKRLCFFASATAAAVAEHKREFCRSQTICDDNNRRKFCYLPLVELRFADCRPTFSRRDRRRDSFCALRFTILATTSAVTRLALRRRAPGSVSERAFAQATATAATRERQRPAAARRTANGGAKVDDRCRRLAADLRDFSPHACGRATRRTAFDQHAKFEVSKNIYETCGNQKIGILECRDARKRLARGT